MKPSSGNPPSSSKYNFRMKARNVGVGAYHVSTIIEPDEYETAECEVIPQEQGRPQQEQEQEHEHEHEHEHEQEQEQEQEHTVEVEQEQEQEQEVEVEVQSRRRGDIITQAQMSRRNETQHVDEVSRNRALIGYFQSRNSKACLVLASLLVFVILFNLVRFTLHPGIRDDDGNEDVNGTAVHAPVMRQYCDTKNLLPKIYSERIAKRTDRFQALQSVLFEMEGMDYYDNGSFDDSCGPHNFALRWLADEDEIQLEPQEIDAVYQRFVVALFYFSTNMQSTMLARDPKRVQSTWLSQESECAWFGITCTNTTRLSFNKIISIELSYVDLEGSIPNELFFHLDSLATLDLSTNDLTGTIPSSLYSSTSLVNVNLGSNILSGVISKSDWKTSNMGT
eukprot:scaffold137774_cov43-Attheya_sp.AAC.2